MTQRPELTKEAFLAIVAQVGLDPNDPHMDDLYPEVKGLVQRLATVDEIDTSGVDPINSFKIDKEGT